MTIPQTNKALERTRVPLETLAKYRGLLEEAVRQKHDYPKGRFESRGIVICGGGWKYFPAAYVAIRALRHLGCELPIELWHLGPAEMTREMREIVSAFNVETVDGHEIAKEYPVRCLRGWELKCYALIHSRFKEVILLDSDNVPIRDPEFLFDTPQYKELGAIFWPDYGRFAREHVIWEITGLAYRDEPEFESGQIVIDKERCWHALQISMHMNEHSDFYYRHILGDKDTFHIAWRLLRQDYAMPAYEIHPMRYTMCQHDFDGNRLFQHRNMDKWRVGGHNVPIEGFALQDECNSWLVELADLFDSTPTNARRFDWRNRCPEEISAAEELIAYVFDYHRVGYDRRELEFSRWGWLSVGLRARELVWDIQTIENRVWLYVYGERGLTMRLARDGDGVWRGEWEHCERMPIELTPIRLVETSLTRAEAPQKG